MDDEAQRRYYSLKPKDFERVNALEERAGADPNDVHAMLKQNLAQQEAKARVTKETRSARATNESDPNDVYTLLQDNLTKHKASEQPLDMSKPASRRRRDYFGALILGNCLLLGLWLLFPINAVTILFLTGAITMYSVGLSWVFWAVMSDY